MHICMLPFANKILKKRLIQLPNLLYCNCTLLIFHYLFFPHVSMANKIVIFSLKRKMISPPHRQA